jgi:ribose transport system permease protein
LPFATLLALFLGLSLASPHFLTVANLSSVARQTAVINLIALGMTLVVVSGGIDLSVGSLLAFCAIAGTMALERGAPVAAAVLVGMVCGAAWGSVNGFLSARLGITPFIVTLGTLGMIRGVTLIVSRGLPVVNLPKEFSWLGEGSVGPVPAPLLILAAAAAFMHLVLVRTKLGRYAYAMGSNREAARYAGVPLAKYTVAVYAMSGMLTGLAGMVEASRLMTGQPTSGEGYELRAIAAVVIGGGSLHGGEGTVVGTLIGALIMGLLANGANLLGVSPFWQQVLIGAVIIAAVALDEWRKRR